MASKGIFWLFMSLAVLVGHANAAGDPNNPFVLSVNGHPVDREEFGWFTQRERAAVFQFVNTTYHLQPGKDFWDQACDGTTPKQILHEKTTEKIVREKVQQILFKELGLIQDIRFTAFLENLKKLNQERQVAVEQGRVVYGPVQYTPLQYYGHWMATMQIQAKDKLRKEQFDVTEPKIRDWYRRNKEPFKTAQSSTLEPIVIRSGQTADSQDSRDPLESLADEIVLKVQRGQTLESAALEYTERKDVAILFRRYEQMSDDRMGELFPDGDQLKQTGSLVPGQTIQLARATNEIWLVKCISITASDYLPYEQIRSRVVDRWIDTEYDRLIETRIKNAQIEINRKVLDNIKIP